MNEKRNNQKNNTLTNKKEWEDMTVGEKIIGIVGIIVLVVLFIVIIDAIFSGSDTQETEMVTETTEKQVSTKIPQYRVLNKTEHISTRMSDDQASYFGDVLIEENIIDIPPEEFIKIARIIAEREDLNQSTSFYITEDAYKANATLYVSDEYRDIHEQTGMKLENNEEYRTPEEISAFMYEGYIGNLKENEFRMSPSSAYYEQHHGDSDNNDNSATQNQHMQTQSEPELESVTPSETVSQKNAVRSAKAYLDHSAFSRDGLITQLEYEQFPHADAVYGTDNSGADWYEQAAKSAEAYMEYSAFSRGGLIEQLKFEGFTQAQAEHGADSVGL